MFSTTRNYLSLIRFSHTLFALPFALLAALMAWHLRAIEELTHPVHLNADGSYSGLWNHDYYIGFAGRKFDLDWLFVSGFSIRWQELIGILLCMATARSAAMAFNRLVDRRFDAANPRTAGRHLPAGILSVGHVTAFVAVSIALFVASTLLFLPNRLPLYFSLPVLGWLLGYSYAKRFTALSHYWLGVALAMTPVASWIAIRGEVLAEHPMDLAPAVVLGAAVLTWVGGFDVIYSCQDDAYDRSAGLHSIPAWLGVAGALRLAAASHFATIVLLALVPLVYPPFGWIYGGGVAAVAGLLLYEHALVRPDDLERVNTAFFNVNAVISMGLLAVGCLDLLVS